MSYAYLKPNNTTLNTGAVTGASAHAALSDDSNSTYVTYAYNTATSLQFEDLSIDSDAVIIAAQLRGKVGRDGTGPGQWFSRLNVAGQKPIEYSNISWEIPAHAYGAGWWGALTDANLDAATASVGNLGSLSEVVLYELDIRVTYLEQPVVDVVAPSGTITTNVPTVDWASTFDLHADATVPRYRVRVFSQAQYSAGGFNPDSSVSVLDSGELTSGTPEHAFTDWLVDGNYRAYVKVAATNAPDQWSAWDYSAFTVDAPNPGIPTLSATGEDAQGRIKLEIDDTSGEISTSSFQVQRADDGVNFVNVRTSLGDGMVNTTGPLVTLFDYEAPNGTTVTYRARAFNAATPSWSNWTTDTEGWESDQVWLKCATHPSLNWTGVLRSYPASQIPANQGVFRPLGCSKAVVVSDVPGPETGQIVVMTEDEDDRAALTALLATGSPVLLQAEGHPDRWVSFGDRGSDRLADKSWVSEHDETLPWTVVEFPTGPLEE